MCQRTTVGILPVSECVYSNYALWNWENNYEIGLEIHWTNCEMDLSHVLVYIFLHNNLF